MKIISIETFTNEYMGFVRVCSDEGDEGWGQTCTYNADISAQVVHKQVAPHVLGWSAQDIKDLNREVLEREHKFPGTYLMRALSGLDTALWDIHGKRAGLSVHQLLGGDNSRVPVYASSMRRDISAEAEADRLLALKEEHGYHSFKFRIGRECGHDEDQWPGRTQAIVSQVRKVLGDDVNLLVDANSAYTPTKAIEVGHMLQDFGVSHFEEPCPYWQPDWTRQVKEALSLDVSGGEQDYDMRVWRHMIETGVVDIVQPDVCYMGGVTRTLEVAKMAQQANLPITLHCANLSLVTLFSAHLMAAMPNAGKYLEFAIEGLDYYPWQRQLFSPGFRIEQGELLLSEKPGWGIEPDPEWLRLNDYQVSYMGDRF
ncbi:MAG: mandelate racemase/muconate lactonizing enzyme family protein [Gammaproteobacteria bacterium]|nr:mandelate racemase/muconate lactonizing enzyme family protein [Gammaproteobacteria bacterium]